MACELLEAMLTRGQVDHAKHARVFKAFHTTIAQSFREHPCQITQHETRRRFKILERWFRELRAGHGWSVASILDALPKALRAELNGQVWEPPPVPRVWTP